MGTKSAPKQVRVAARKQRRNRSVRSEVKTDITKAEKLIFAGDAAAAEKAVKTAVIALDKAAEKGILHANAAARRKSRLVKKLNAMSSPPAAAKAAPEPAAEAEPEAEKAE